MFTIRLHHIANGGSEFYAVHCNKKKPREPSSGLLFRKWRLPVAVSLFKELSSSLALNSRLNGLACQYHLHQFSPDSLELDRGSQGKIARRTEQFWAGARAAVAADSQHESLFHRGDQKMKIVPVNVSSFQCWLTLA